MVHVTLRTVALSVCTAAISLGACGGAAKYDRSMAYSPAPNPGVAIAGGANTHRAEQASSESYATIVENQFRATAEQPTSTFAIDVDTAAYSNVRRFLRAGNRPPANAVRVEELINYFRYDYPEPIGPHPFSITTEVGPSPWNSNNKLLRIGLKGRSLKKGAMPRRNLVFLLDVSGSMSSRNKLPLLAQGLSMLVDNLTSKDRVSIVVYAGAAGTVLAPTRGDDKQTILAALRRLRAGGSTNGGAGIHLAYKLAQDNFDKDGINRVILATDGDFNVGTTNRRSLVELIEAKRKTGVFLTVLGFGTGNIKDDTMEMLANKGNGNYAYIDSITEARKVLVTQAGGTLVTIAKDVKIQLELNAKRVSSYRLIGYENRLLRNQDFDNDRKDAGEIGAGHTVTALYELVPAPGSPAGQLANVKLRYKLPQGTKSTLLSQPVGDTTANLGKTSVDYKLAAGVAAFGMLLRDSKHKGNADFNMAAGLVRASLSRDDHGYRRQLLGLIDKAAALFAKAKTLAR